MTTSYQSRIWILSNYSNIYDDHHILSDKKVFKKNMENILFFNIDKIVTDLSHRGH